jgi:hypothetical protein
LGGDGVQPGEAGASAGGLSRPGCAAPVEKQGFFMKEPFAVGRRDKMKPEADHSPRAQPPSRHDPLFGKSSRRGLKRQAQYRERG